MKHRVFLVLLVLFCSSLVSASTFADQRDKPNIIFMMADDQSWEGTSVPMHPSIGSNSSTVYHTPNLAKLAKQGMRFSAAYSPASVCAPTRISLQNGKSAAANKWTKAGPSLVASANPKLIPPQSIRSIKTSDVTFGELLQSAGYMTAHFGKWHINGGGPGRHGFHVHDGNIGNEAASRYRDPNPVDIFGMAERAEKFMAKCKSANKPFFIQLSWLALHAPENALKKTVEKYRQSMNTDRRVSRIALTEDLDTGVGRIMNSLEKLGLSDNTYLIYTSDNGGGGGRRRGNRRTLAGGKGSVWEGGIRVPLIIRGPGIKANSWCHVPVVLYDFFPTYCQWACVQIPARVQKQIEGGDISSLLKNGTGTVKRNREEIVFHFPHYQSNDGPHSAIRLGNFKLIYFFETKTAKLFDLAKDIGEQNDLSKRYPEKRRQLQKLLDKYLKDVDAQMPVVNRNYDPDKPTTVRRGSRRGKNGGQRGKSGRNRKNNRGKSDK